MSDLTQLLLGTTIVCFTSAAIFGYQWMRELDRHNVTRASRDGLRAMLRATAADPAAVAAAVVRTPDVRRGLRLADEQQQTRALADADHHALKDVS